MLKKIRVDQLQLGMHLHGLCGPWLAHALWRSRFVLTDPADLAKVRSSGVLECLIDPSKGLDLPGLGRTPAARTALPPPAAAQTLPAAAVAAPASAGAHTRLEDESERALHICAQARHTVAALYDEARMGRALDVTGCAPMVEEIAGSMQRNASALLGIVRLKSHDDYTFMHSVAVCTLMVVLSRQLGCDEAQVREAGLAGLLHDLGKARIPLQVLNKPGKLSAEEFELVKRHPRDGHDMLRAAGLPDAVVLDVCLHHHERPDGLGYPEGLSGAAFTLPARMAAVCDVYDAITSRRPYKEGWGPADSIAQMSVWAKAGKFDAAVFRAFVDCVGIYPVGTLVRLQSQRLAVVVEQSRASLVAPHVKVFYSIRAQMSIPVEPLDLSQPGCRDRILGRESNSQWRFPFLDALSTTSVVLPTGRRQSKETVPCADG